MAQLAHRLGGSFAVSIVPYEMDKHSQENIGLDLLNMFFRLCKAMGIKASMVIAQAEKLKPLT